MAQTSYSIAEARNQFTVLVRDVEKTAKPVEVTRRGKPVAIILSTEEYVRLMDNQPKRDFWTACLQWRQKWRVDELGINPDEVWGDVRDRKPVPDSDPWD